MKLHQMLGLLLPAVALKVDDSPFPTFDVGLNVRLAIDAQREASNDLQRAIHDLIAETDPRGPYGKPVPA